jgi:hypothetical protein
MGRPVTYCSCSIAAVEIYLNVSEDLSLILDCHYFICIQSTCISYIKHQVLLHWLAGGLVESLEVSVWLLYDMWCDQIVIGLNYFCIMTPTHCCSLENDHCKPIGCATL